MKITSHSLAETEAFAGEFLALIKKMRLKAAKGSVKNACVVGLYGDLGSGKTAFTQAAARLLGITETVTSPTYVIEKVYSPKGKSAADAAHIANSLQTSFKHLIHIDAYRLEKSAELMHLGWIEIISDPENLVLIEWPEKVADIMPAEHIRLKFTFIDENVREIELVAPSATMNA